MKYLKKNKKKMDLEIKTDTVETLEQGNGSDFRFKERSDESLPVWQDKSKPNKECYITLNQWTWRRRLICLDINIRLHIPVSHTPAVMTSLCLTWHFLESPRNLMSSPSALNESFGSSSGSSSLSFESTDLNLETQMTHPPTIEINGFEQIDSWKQ